MQRPLRVEQGLKCGKLYDLQPAILSTNKQVNDEAHSILYNDNLFVLVRYPHGFESNFWTETVGLTLLATGQNEVRCLWSVLPISLQVDLGIISAPENLVFHAESQLVIAANELPVLCRCLKRLDNEGGDNEDRRFLATLKLVLKMFPSYSLGVDVFVSIEPSSRASWRPRSLPQQRRLLEPFAALHSVRDLEIADVHGKTQFVDAQLVQYVKEMARQPPDSMSGILDKSTKIKEKGNEAFRGGDFSLADSLYTLAKDNLDIGLRYCSKGSKEGLPSDMPEITYFRAHFLLALQTCSNSVAALLCLKQWTAAHEKATMVIGQIGLAENEIRIDPGEMAKIYRRRALASQGMGQTAQALEEISQARTKMEATWKDSKQLQAALKTLTIFKPRLASQ